MHIPFCDAGSECNSAMLTFDGIDVMGARLADEVSYGLPFLAFYVSKIFLSFSFCSIESNKMKDFSLSFSRLYQL